MPSRRCPWWPCCPTCPCHRSRKRRARGRRAGQRGTSCVRSRGRSLGDTHNHGFRPGQRACPGRDVRAGARHCCCMRILVLGGTAWLGREVAVQARNARHEVVCVARGESGAVAEGVRLLVADRDRADALAPLLGQRWDAAVDVSRQPGHVRRASEALSDVAHFVFVSTANVYADETTPDQDETSALREPLGSDTMASMEEYGPAKVACEQAVQDVYGERCTIARAG